MALGANELWGSQDRDALSRLEPLATKVVHLEDNAGSAPVLLPRGTPLAYDTSTNQWCVWEQGGSNSRDVIKGFLLEDSYDDETDDTLQVILLRGRVHRDDVNTAAIRAVCGGTASEANLDAALRVSPGLREAGIDVVGLTQIR